MPYHNHFVFRPYARLLVISIAVGALIWTFLRKELRTKGLLYSSFLIACLVSLWPIDQKIKLGLDLKGGMPKVIAEIPVPASVVGPPVSVAISPDEAEKRLATTATPGH